jgi:hypothetical protein
VHGLDGDLDGFLARRGFGHFAAVVPTPLRELLPALFAQAQTHRVIRGLLDRLALGLGTLLNLLEYVVRHRDRFLRSHGCLCFLYTTSSATAGLSNVIPHPVLESLTQRRGLCITKGQIPPHLEFAMHTGQR